MIPDINERMAKAKGYPALEARLILFLRVPERETDLQISKRFGRSVRWVRDRVRMYFKAQKHLNAMTVGELDYFGEGH